MTHLQIKAACRNETHLRAFDIMLKGEGMVELVYLSSGEEMPDGGDDQPWLIVEASNDGLFFGSGASWKQNGDWVGYRSLNEDDISLELALAAAKEWAVKYGVPTIWVQECP